MHQKSFSKGNYKKPYSHNKPGFNRGLSRFGANKKQGGGRPGERIDPARFINKAMSAAEEAVVITPTHQFADFALDPKLTAAVAAKGYKTPTPIQDHAIPQILAGKDIVGLADTGTGKTGAFLIPLVNKVLRDRRQQVLVIVPTRELAQQIEDELKGFVRGMQIFSVCVVGGASIGPQLSALRHKNNFVIGTPGRLKDLIERRSIRLGEFQTVVLDEADRMLDMGFVQDMRFVMQGMPAPRHTLFFSATINSTIESLIKEFLREPVRLSMKTRDTSKNVEQDIVRVAGGGAGKIDALHNLLTQKEFNKVLVFGRTKHGVERLSKSLVQRGFTAESIHGNKSQSQRERALLKFKDNRAQVLVATDVAARGLDIADVSHVINYDLPQSYDDYVHRIGRTGRANKKGKALTFIEHGK